MTRPATIPQGETERLLKAARAAGWPHVTLRLDLDQRVIVATMSDSPLAPVEAPPGDDGWDDDD